MRTRILALLVAGAMAGGYVGVAEAKSPNAGGNPGPNGHNDHGLCTAYFNGQKNGHEQGNSPGPFGALEDANGDDVQAIYDFCRAVEGGIGGNPDENGRFTDCFTDANDDPSDDCTDGDP